MKVSVHVNSFGRGARYVWKWGRQGEIRLAPPCVVRRERVCRCIYATLDALGPFEEALSSLLNSYYLLNRWKKCKSVWNMIVLLVFLSEKKSFSFFFCRAISWHHIQIPFCGKMVGCVALYETIKLTTNRQSVISRHSETEPDATWWMTRLTCM